MFEKFKERFDQQKSDDAFVESATNANTRQTTIDKLVKARAKMSPLLLLVVALYAFSFLLALFAPAPASVSKAQSLGNAGQGLVMVCVLISYTIIDYQIKFLKTLEASAQKSGI